MQKSKSLKKNNILVIAAHPDDEMLGCGGSIIKLKKKCDIKVLFMTDGVSARKKNHKKILERRNSCEKLFKKLKIKKPVFLDFPDNQMDKVPLLEIVKKIERIIKEIKPHTIFTHYSDCLNIDHQITCKAVLTACRPIKNNTVKKILSFEILSSTEWSKFKNKGFEPNYFIDITKEIKNKISSMKYYKMELRKYPHSRSIKAIEALASFRGVSCGVKYAEGFYLNRLVE
jgi:N-acetylglucosamine malate deacetylase 1